MPSVCAVWATMTPNFRTTLPARILIVPSVCSSAALLGIDDALQAQILAETELARCAAAVPAQSAISAGQRRRRLA